MVEVYDNPIFVDYLLNGLHMDERHEVCPDGEWIQACRRVAERPELFVFRHRETGNWVLAQWLWDNGCGKRICQELETMEVAPDRGGWKELEYVKQRCRPYNEQMADFRRAMRGYRTAAKRVNDEDLAEREDTRRWLRRQGQVELAETLNQNWRGSASGGERLEELRKDLGDLAKGKVSVRV